MFPGAVGLFSDLDSDISLRFLERFTTQAQADWLSTKRLAAWLRGARYRGRTTPEALHARLTSAAHAEGGDHDAADAATTLAFVATLRALNTQIAALADRIAEQLALHPDGQIFTTLPRADTVRAAQQPGGRNSGSAIILASGCAPPW